MNNLSHHATTTRLAAAAMLLLGAFSPAVHAAPLQATAVAAAPEGFDAVHATDEQIAAFALPPRPDTLQAPDAYRKWVRAMTLHGKRLLAPLQDTAIYHGPMLQPARSQLSNTTYTSSNWSGGVSYNGLTSYNGVRSFYYILSDFVIPTATNATCDGGWDYSSTWDGIDGWGSGDVLQAGTESDAYCSGGSTSTFYSAWIEWYPYSESRISGFAVSPGDDVFVEVWNTSPVIGYAYLENISTGQTVEYQLTPPSGTSLVGNSAEFVVERPGVNGGLATLSAYGLDYQSSAAAGNFKGLTYVPGAGASSFLVNMLDNSGNTISAPTALGRNALEFVYQ